MDFVHDHFHVWFTWGFVSFIPFLLCLPVPLVGTLLSACSACSLEAWWIAGMVWRLRNSGKYASGDVVPAFSTEDEWITAITGESSWYQYESGRFMYIYLLITWITLGISCGCATLGCIFTAITACCNK